jgi:hypothetical protein
MQRLKENPVRSKLYRQTVAALPCVNCGIWGYSQAAHPPPTGKGIKESDLDCFPLCCVRPGITGCHQDFDLYRLITPEYMREQASQWKAETQAKIKAAGEWLPEWEEPARNMST